MANHKEILNHHWQRLLEFPNVLNTAVGTKVKNGEDTKIPAIVVYVSKKLPEVELAAEHIIPKELEGIPTDIVEFAPETWTAGKTSISQLPPEEQHKRLGATIVPRQELKKTISTTQSSGQSDWTTYANPIQDQKSCGSCVAFDITGVWEALINIASGQLLKLSESHLFFCGGGSCGYGSTVSGLLNQARKGVCLESCLPYDQNVQNGNNEICGQGICSNWWLDAQKIKDWHATSDPIEILLLLDSGPLVATFAVPQSFLNYTGGIYSRLANDPIIGHHGVGIFGYLGSCYKLLRNSWGLGWAQNCVINGVARPGWCMIDPSLLDATMYQITPDGPVPEPSPSPSPCKVANKTLKVPNWILKKTGHQGRLYYR
jgi:hypothetical protein